MADAVSLNTVADSWVIFVVTFYWRNLSGLRVLSHILDQFQAGLQQSCRCMSKMPKTHFQPPGEEAIFQSRSLAVGRHPHLRILCCVALRIMHRLMEVQQFPRLLHKLQLPEPAMCLKSCEPNEFFAKRGPPQPQLHMSRLNYIRIFESPSRMWSPSQLRIDAIARVCIYPHRQIFRLSADGPLRRTATSRLE